MSFRLGLVWALLALSSASNLSCTKKKQFWIYTSIYKEVVSELDISLRKQFPDRDIQWFQAGSETVASKVIAEMAGGGTRADIILTSDPFWYAELKANQSLLPYESPEARKVPARFRDPDNQYVTVRIPLMVIGYHSQLIKKDQAPTRWSDLTLPRYKGQISMGNPLESGTHFSTVAMLSQMKGWDLFSGLRKNEIMSAGGNSAVIHRIESKERPIGIVLLENILKNKNQGSPIEIVYPSDGAIPVASPIAILKSSKDPEFAKKVYDWFFTAEAQNALVRQGMYSPLPGFAPPPGAEKWDALESKMAPWSESRFQELLNLREQMKSKFSELVLH